VVALSIQIIESNPHLRSLLGWHLQEVGYQVQQSANLYQARDALRLQQPNLVVLSTDLPDGDGLELCRWLHCHLQVMILMLSARSGESDIVAGLRSGADDYLTKPFGMQEFLARVEALGRRQRLVIPADCLDLADLKIDLVHRRVHFQGDLIELTPQEFSLLYVLAQANGTALSRSHLLQRAWPDAIDNPRTVDTHILSLRKKVERDPRQPDLIQTVRNVGYRLNVEGLNHLDPDRRPPTELHPLGTALT
jgi:two-component system, OmpR family, response regulator